MTDIGLLTQHICKTCKMKFEENEEKAIKHSKIPIKEGNYDFIVLKKEVYPREYTFFMKNEKVNYKHEREYYLAHLKDVDDLIVGCLPHNFMKTREVNYSSPGWSSSLIENSIFEQNLVPLSKEELNKINALITLDIIHIPFLDEKKVEDRLFKTYLN
jgi:hypothetical protein